jgi:hypothetical protein
MGYSSGKKGTFEKRREEKRESFAKRQRRFCILYSPAIPQIVPLSILIRF